MELSELLASKRIKTAKSAFRIAFQSYISNREQTFGRIDVESLKNRAREIKKCSIQNLKQLKEKAVETLQLQGVKVFEAKDAEEAKKIALKLIPEKTLIAKSKSNTINEIGLKEALKGRNEVVETDCGDFIVDLCEEESSHPVTPALHIPIDRMVQKIEEKFKVKLEPSPEKIVEYVKSYIRKRIAEADVGLTGANFISSDGSIIILENEGNISLISRLEKHVVIAGIDRIVPTAEDAVTLCKAAAVWGTGTSLPTYINIISSPSKTADVEKKIVYGMQGAKEVYLILVDNGRSKAVEQGLGEILYCINCGSCLYFCPVYRQVFDSYGLHYFGGIGVSKLAFTNDLKEAFDRGLYYCTTCQACKVNCPVGIDVPEIMKKLREFAVKSRLETESNKKMIENVRAYGNPFGKVEEGKIPEKLYCC
jgi:L-lactate utilization protein LutB